MPDSEDNCERREIVLNWLRNIINELTVMWCSEFVLYTVRFHLNIFNIIAERIAYMTYDSNLIPRPLRFGNETCTIPCTCTALHTKGIVTVMLQTSWNGISVAKYTSQTLPQVSS